MTYPLNLVASLWMGGQLDLEQLGGGKVEGAKHEQLDGGQDGQLGQAGKQETNVSLQPTTSSLPLPQISLKV